MPIAAYAALTQKRDEELLQYDADILGLCEVDHFDDFFEPELGAAGFHGTFKRKRRFLSQLYHVTAHPAVFCNAAFASP